MKSTILITLISIFIFLVVVESYIIGYGYYSNNSGIAIINPETRQLYQEKGPEQIAETKSIITDTASTTVNNSTNDLTAGIPIAKPALEKSVDGLEIDTNYEYVTDKKIKSDYLSIVTTDKNIYVKKNGEWKHLLRYGIKESALFTSCEIVNINEETYIFIGTSYTGIYYKSLKNKNFTQLSDGLKIPFATTKGMNYIETVNSLFIIKDHLYIGYAYSKGIQRINLKDRQFKVQDTDLQLVNEVDEKIDEFYFLTGSLFAETGYAVYQFDENSLKWNILQRKPETQKKEESVIRGIYLNPYSVSNEKKIDNYIKLANDLGLNAFVVDLKDDMGYIDYDTSVDLAIKMKSKRKLVKLDYLLEKCKVPGIKIIARLVCFKDYIAYEYNKNEYALWNYKTDKAWEGNKGEKWVDPYNEKYQQYLIDIAKELEAKGIYEIQFDYVRFPSDGETYKIKYRYKKDITGKNILLYSFFKKAKSEIHIPVSADFYGYNCWYRMNEYIGQDLYLISDYLDAIYPMYYPSHFSKGFYRKNLTQYETNYYIYYHGTSRAYDNTKKQTEVRPWIQAFRMDVDIQYKDYIKSQLYGIQKAGKNSFIFWNAGSEYSILNEIL